MRFNDPALLKHLLWLIPALTAFCLWAAHSYRKQSIRFADEEMLPKITASNAGKRRAIKILLDIIAIMLMVIAIARPQWGLAWQQKTAEGLDILFAVDLSKSMLAQDVSPDRLSYTKQEIRDFVGRLKGDRVGLIGFAGDSFLFCPLSSDYSGFSLALDNTTVGSVPRGGTHIASVVKEAIKTFSWALTEQKILILISDGEETEGDVKKAAEAARQANIEIDCIGIGTPEGSAVVYTDGNDEKATLKDESGNTVISKLGEDTLKAIAEATGGVYVRADKAEFGLEKIYEERLSKLKKRQGDETLSRSYREQFQYPLALAFILIFISTAIGMTGGYGKD